MENFKNNLMPVAVFLLGLGLGYFIFHDSSGSEVASNSVLSERIECKKLAIQKLDELNFNQTDNVTFDLLETAYIEKTKKCYAEYNKNGLSSWTGGIFREFVIFELPSDKEINALTYYEDPVTEEHLSYYEEKKPLYEKDRKNLFGSGSYR